MKIDSANLLLNSNHLAYVREETKETLRMWSGSRRPDFAGTDSRGNNLTPRISLSAQARALAPTPSPSTTLEANPASAIDNAMDAADNDPFLRLIRSMIEILTGKSIRIYSAKDMPTPAPAGTDAASTNAPQGAAPGGNPTAGFGIEYDYHAVREEVEQTSVAATGVVRTADGKEIRFTLDLSMSRSHREERNISLRAGDAIRKDPLVLNFDGTAAQLTNQHFRFDLNGDGLKEELPMLAGGNGYLALDLNQNGRIDSGRELFGPATNAGFGELSALDSDHNGWIDENDAAFGALRIWTPDATGAGTLETLRERQVGAIALAHVASPFALRGTGNTDLGAVTASGIFLTESGKAGAIQEIDLTI